MSLVPAALSAHTKPALVRFSVTALFATIAQREQACFHHSNFYTSATKEVFAS